MIADLSRPPADSHTHHWADYVELLCLANVDGELSRSDLEARYDRLAELSTDIDMEDDTDAVKSTAGQGAAGAPADNSSGGGPDEVETKATDVFRHLAYRQGVFGDAYPFEVEEGTETLHKRSAPLTLPQLAYVFLLCASSLRCMDRRSWGTVTKSFERLATEAIRRMLPPAAEVHVFGTAARAGDKYFGPKHEKIAALAKDIYEQILFEPADFSDKDFGDYGLDTAAWIPFGDPLGNFVILFGQATCENEWKDKQLQSSYDKWSNVMTFRTPPNNAMVVPFCFRQPSGAWYARMDIYSTVFIDRVRIMSLLAATLEEEVESVPYDLVTTALEYREAL